MSKALVCHFLIGLSAIGEYIFQVLFRRGLARTTPPSAALDLRTPKTQRQLKDGLGKFYRTSNNQSDWLDPIAFGFPWEKKRDPKCPDWDQNMKEKKENKNHKFKKKKKKLCE